MIFTESDICFYHEYGSGVSESLNVLEQAVRSDSDRREFLYNYNANEYSPVPLSARGQGYVLGFEAWQRGGPVTDSACQLNIRLPFSAAVEKIQATLREQGFLEGEEGSSIWEVIENTISLSNSVV